jgi:methionine-gamma-lyase
MKHGIGFASLCAQEMQDNKSTKPHQLPLYATSSFEFENVEEGMRIFKGEKSGHVYARFGNPTVDTVASKLARLEAYGLGFDVHAILVSSGMSAISTLMLSLLQPGDKILTQGSLYGGTTELFGKVLGPLGIRSVVERLIKNDPAFKAIYYETPANPTLACVDIQALSDIAHRHGRLSIADNTFCTPYVQQPLRFGADFVIHSTTKYLNGHGNGVAGVIIGRDVEWMKEKVFTTMKLAGTNCNAWDAWLINNGLKTLAIRMERHSQNALTVARFLKKHPGVETVNHPGLPDHPDHELARRQMNAFGGMLSFELKGGLEAGIRFMNRLELCSLAPTLGDVDTILLHPASMSHVNIDRDVRLASGITDGLVRVSVGIEAVDDIIGDLDRAMGN